MSSCQGRFAPARGSALPPPSRAATTFSTVAHDRSQDWAQWCAQPVGGARTQAEHPPPAATHFDVWSTATGRQCCHQLCWQWWQRVELRRGKADAGGGCAFHAASTRLTSVCQVRLPLQPGRCEVVLSAPTRRPSALKAPCQAHTVPTLSHRISLACIQGLESTSQGRTGEGFVLCPAGLRLRPAALQNQPAAWLEANLLCCVCTSVLAFSRSANRKPDWIDCRPSRRLANDHESLRSRAERCTAHGPPLPLALSRPLGPRAELLCTALLNPWACSCERSDLAQCVSIAIMA
jgi:hypothetical protein